MYAAPEIRVTNKLIIIDSIATSNLTCSSLYSKIFCPSCKVLYRCMNLYFIPIMLRLLNMTLLLQCLLTKVITISGHNTLVFHIPYIKVNHIIISLYYTAINFSICQSCQNSNFCTNFTKYAIQIIIENTSIYLRLFFFPFGYTFGLFNIP